MESLPLYTAEQSRHCDKALIASGIAGFELMTRASTAAWQQAKRMLLGAVSPRIYVFCGMGNNGGDGLVLASLAWQEGYDVSVFFASSPERYQGEALQAWQQLQEIGVPTQPIEACEGIDADLVVDALLGTGLNSAVRDPYASAISTINSSNCAVLSIDIPSGISADTGGVMGDAVRADCTISFIVRKQGLYSGKGLLYAGEVLFDDLVRQAGNDNSAHEAATYDAIISDFQPAAEICFLEMLLRRLPVRQRDANKGAYGHSLLMGGNLGMAGAIILAAEACARSGAGLTSVATRPQNTLPLLVRTPEVMAHGVDEADDVQALLSRATVIGIGPGLGQDAWARELYRAILDLEVPLPLVVDADALNLIASGEVPAPDSGCWIMCPHPKEAARLLNTSVDVIEADRFKAARQLRDQYGAVVVLKGAGTVVLSLEDGVEICPYGNPGMASGGMGDVLTGIITGLVAQGMSLAGAATLGVSLHARAADNAVKSTGQCGLLASDLMPALMRLLP